MLRKPGRVSPLQRHKQRFAAEFDEALGIGQRGDGVPRARWVEWGNTEFAAKMPGRKADATAVPGAVAHWRNIAKPVTPDKSVIQSILDALYGDRFPQQRQTMLQLWENARGLAADDEDQVDPLDGLLDWDDRPSWYFINGIDLRLHRPRRVNEPGLMRIEASLWVEPAEYDHDSGEVVIGVREPVLSIESARYQPAKQSMIGVRPHDNFVPVAGGAKIVAPHDGRGRVNGDPLGDDYVAVVEPRAEGEEEQVTVLLSASRRCFDVARREASGHEVLHPNKDAVLNALIDSKLDKHVSGRVILAKAQMRYQPK